jgi:undecaprenyl-diphosphatase
MSTLWQLNYILFRVLNAPAGSHPLLDQAMIFCADLLIFAWLPFLLVVWGLPESWRRQPLQPLEQILLQERRAMVIWVGIACLLAYGLNLLIEQVVFEPRPFVTYSVHLLVHHAADASFPSDHTAWSFAALGMLLLASLPPLLGAWRRGTLLREASGRWLIVPGLLVLIAVVLACSIGLARIYVGVHYPDDILGGAVNGLLAATATTWLRRRLQSPTQAFLRLAAMLHLA